MDPPLLSPRHPFLSSSSFLPSNQSSTSPFSTSLTPFPETTDLRNAEIHESSLRFDGDDNEMTLEMNCDDYPLEEDVNLKNVQEPKVGMSFNSEDEARNYYVSYAKEQGFGVITRSSRKRDDGRKRYVTYCCHKGGKARITSLNPIKAHPSAKTGCKASMNICLDADGKWVINTIQLEHNHEMCPNKVRYLKFYRVIPEHTKRMMELNRLAGIKMNKTISSCVIEAKGFENMTWLEKDARNYIDQVRRSELKEGDAEAMHKYFKRMQADNGNFFYAMDVDKENRLCNVFWADARSREACKEYGDVVTFDTTYLVNKYDMPFAPFVGVNHHGQSILLGCGLILREDTSSFVWLFETWLACMSGCSPNGIITDQCKAMQNAISIVFPNARHRWCLWHILKKVPEKLKSYKAYESIKYGLLDAVFDSISIWEFEQNWKNVIDKYQLGDNQWLSGLYEERHRWVPAFVKDTFWAGMSTTQRSESMNAFFDGYVHSNTTLKEFVGQYENALRKKVQKEEEEDAYSFNVQVTKVSPYGFENQFQEAYTISKCRELQTQLAGKIACTLNSMKTMDGISEFEIEEDIKCGESEYLKTVAFHVRFDKASMESSCTCRLFECKGMVCKHILVVWTKEKLKSVPEKYILRRWRKNVMRSHTNVKVSYVNCERKPEWRRFDMMMTVFNEAANNATYSDAKSARVVAKLREAIVENEVCNDECPIPPMPIDVQESSVSPKNKQKPIGDPNKARRRGRPPGNRKKPFIEKIVKKARQTSKKIPCCRAQTNNRLALVNEEDAGVITQEDVTVGMSQMRGSHVGMWSYDLNETLLDVEN